MIFRNLQNNLQKMSFELILMAWESLMSKKSRTFLSTLGIIIGVFVVILMITIGDVAEQQITKQFKSVNVTSLMVVPESTGNTESKLDAEDIDFVLSRSRFVEKGTAIISANGRVSFGTEYSSAVITGVSKDFFEMNNLTLEAGRFLNQKDIDSRTRLTVLGKSIFENIFPHLLSKDVLGKEIFMSGKRMEIVGILDPLGAVGPVSFDDSVFIPYSTAESKILGDQAIVKLSFTGKNVEVLPLAKKEITILLRQNHHLTEKEEDDFNIIDLGTIVASFTGVTLLLSVLLSAIASIILLVSGIGIMNVMFVTVAERTREIGILKSIGAQKKDILLQFLIESIILSLLGGIIGIILGVSATLLLASFGASISLFGIVLGFGFSVFVGVIFGFYPALQASKLDPVEALRSE